MSNISNTDAVVTESKLTEFYEDIKPFLGCPAYLTSEGTSDYYSTDEKVIGRWIDGKPLYQKTIEVAITTMSAKTAKVYELISDGTDIEFKEAHGNLIRGDGLIYKIPYVNASESNGLAAISINIFQQTDKKVVLQFKNYGAFSNTGTAYCTVFYTKTTDSAATTAQGDPNEYSTDEKIIGKWVDGKPIYQKTWNGSFALSTSASIINSIQVQNVGTMVGAELISDDGVAGNRYAFSYRECGWTSDGKLRITISSGSYTMTSITLRYTKTTD